MPPPPTPLERERRGHEAFASSRRKAYIPNPAYLKRLNEYVDFGSKILDDGLEGTESDESSRPIELRTSNVATPSPLVIYGESGLGKSALLAYWAEQYRRRHPEAFVIEHYVGIGAGSIDHLGIMRHVMGEIKARCHVGHEMPSTPEAIEKEFANWLAFVRHEPLVLVLDGLNRLHGMALNLAWLPKYIPPSVRLILSTATAETLVSMEERQWDMMPLHPLTVGQREAIVVRFLSEYHKALPPDAVRTIAQDPKCCSPLFLRTVLEELRLFGYHEHLDREIRNYLSTTGIEDLFQRVLERLENDYSAESTHEMMSLLWASYNGLSESDLAELTSLTRLKLSTMISGLDYHLVRREGLLTFFHDYLRRAVELRYLPTMELKREVHIRLADFFEKQTAALEATFSLPYSAPVPRRIATEIPYQLRQAEQWDRLKDSLAMIPIFIRLYQGESLYQLLGYWRLLGERYDIAEVYRQSIEQYRQHHPPLTDIVDALLKVGDLLQVVGQWKESKHLVRNALDLAEQLEDSARVATANSALGGLLYLTGAYNEAMECYCEQLAISQAVADRRGIADAFGHMGDIHDCLGEYASAMECYRKELAISEELGDKRGIAIAAENIGLVCSNKGNFNDAMDWYHRSLGITEELGDKRLTSALVGHIGLVYWDQGDYPNAMECYQRELTISEELGDKRGIAMAVGKMGLIYSNQGDYPNAMNAFVKYLALSEELGTSEG